ncbi:extracellular matrix protein 2-like [Astyanax mexicanus]|uniref:Extracellular matrix protein 2-like n=1 Tax=Astyanax mexicanus TaxID=7994 RepID=A0A8B9I1Y6_ASTMX|nr:extracellular matrix protein 2-like [Astyanax mexicanus]
MRAVIVLLFWIFTGAAKTLVLQPSVNISLLQNGSVEVKPWPGAGLDWSREKEQKLVAERPETHVNVVITEKEEETETLHSKDKSGTSEEQSNQDTVSHEEVLHDNRTKTAEEEHGQRSVHAFDDPEEFTNGSKVHPQAEKENGHPSETSPTPKVHLFPSQDANSTVQPIILPTLMTSPPAIKQIISEIKTETTSLPLTQATHVLLTNVSKLLTNWTLTNANTELELELSPTAMAAKAGPTAMSLPNISRPKPQPDTPKSNAKNNRVAKTKQNKLLKKDKSAEKKKKPQKKGLEKVKKTKPKKDEVTTAPYFPYFKDHYCPPHCACYGRVVQCSDKALDTFPYGIPYNSRYILLMNNNITNIPLDLLSEYLSLEFLVLSNNRLMDNSIEGAFEGVQALKRLYLEQNLIQSVPTDLPDSLEELRLDGNKVKVMSEMTWSCCPGLLILSLSNNSLGSGSSTISAGVLSPLVNLKTLSLSYNQLTSVPLNLPISLQELYLRGNLIQRFKGGSFLGRAALQVLDLSANRLTNKGLGKAAFVNATRLESLNLEGNFLKHVPRHLPRSLKTLNLEGNAVSSISKNVFLSLPHLEHLGLARNKISIVAPGAFLMLPLLHQLDLSHNSLRQVPRQLPTWLFSVALTYNKIQTVPRDAFCWARHGKTSKSRLVRVQLENNLVDMESLDSLAFSCLRGFQVVHFY